MASTFLSTVSPFLEALSDGALLYTREKALVAFNARGRARLDALAGDTTDPWRFGDVSLDALLHRVLEGDELAVSEWTQLPHADGLLELRASRIESADAGRHALVLLCPLTASAGAPGGDEPLIRDTRASLLARLLPGVAHQLRGPLTTISGLAQVIAMSGTLPEELGGKLAFVQPQVERADGLLRNVVAFARGPRAGEFLPLSLNEAVRRATELLGHELRACGIEARPLLDRSLPLVGSHPEDVLELVLVLALEAVGCAPAGSRGVLLLETEALADRASRLTVEVAVEGGSTAARSRARLDVAARIASRMGADVREEESPAGHWRFTVTVPGIGTTAEAAPSAADHVLIADPDLDFALGCLRSLPPRGAHVTLARTSEVAARALRHGRIRAALVDTGLAAHLDGAPLPSLTLLTAAPGEEPQARTLAERKGLPWARRADAPARLCRLLEGDLTAADAPPPAASGSRAAAPAATSPRVRPAAAAGRTRAIVR